MSSYFKIGTTPAELVSTLNSTFKAAKKNEINIDTLKQLKVTCEQIINRNASRECHERIAFWDSRVQLARAAAKISPHIDRLIKNRIKYEKKFIINELATNTPQGISDLNVCSKFNNDILEDKEFLKKFFKQALVFKRFDNINAAITACVKNDCLVDQEFHREYIDLINNLRDNTFNQKDAPGYNSILEKLSPDKNLREIK